MLRGLRGLLRKLALTNLLCQTILQLVGSERHRSAVVYRSRIKTVVFWDPISIAEAGRFAAKTVAVNNDRLIALLRWRLRADARCGLLLIQIVPSLHMITLCVAEQRERFLSGGVASALPLFVDDEFHLAGAHKLLHKIVLQLHVVIVTLAHLLYVKVDHSVVASTILFIAFVAIGASAISSAITTTARIIIAAATFFTITFKLHL